MRAVVNIPIKREKQVSVKLFNRFQDYSANVNLLVLIDPQYDKASRSIIGIVDRMEVFSKEVESREHFNVVLDSLIDEKYYLQKSIRFDERNLDKYTANCAVIFDGYVHMLCLVCLEK